MKLRTILGATVLTLGLNAVQAKQPNILFIITDDQDASTLDVYGDKECDTPNLDKLAKQGVALTGAHQMGAFIGAVSSASRTMIMTGRNVWNAKPVFEETKANKKKYSKFCGNVEDVAAGSAESYSLPVLFHNAGYETFRTCKIGNSYEYANQMFDERHDKTCRDGNDDSGSKWHADNAIKYLEDRVKEDNAQKKPFLLYLGFSHPHDPRHGKPELLKKYGAEDIDTPTKITADTPSIPFNWLPEIPFADGNDTCRDENEVFGVMTRRDEVTIRNEVGKEYACIENVDIQIGRVLEALAATGELDNTYIFFTADHGISVGKHGFMGKQNLNDHTFRVPFIAVGPGIPKNKKEVGNVYLMDVLPTLCDLAGISAPECADGMSFKSVIEGREDVIRPSVYGAYSGGEKPGIRTVKQGDWKLIKYDIRSTGDHHTQLFNMKKNPLELTKEHHAAEVIQVTGNKPKANQLNLANDPRYADKLAEMEALLQEQMKSQGDPYTLWDQE